ncbi:MAG: M20/M25/M40 family metallo-hydrolase [Deltaproteobacteria bacterium]
MRKKSVLLISMILCLCEITSINAQDTEYSVKTPEIHDFYPIVQFLASDELEGREPGTKGANIAASYISSMLYNLGLIPYSKNQSSGRELHDYYQKFSFFRLSKGDTIINTLDKGSKDFKFEREIQGINVIGILPGIDTSRSVIIGSHYDHLGIHGDSIFYGADDNASGVAGVLSLAEKWSETRIKPPVNLIFACWTAEEKGLIGSEYFAKHIANPEKFMLYINMDMISRSAPEDTLRNILSIGTRKSDISYRQLSEETNKKLSLRFNLDLWEVDGHSGSDYASFTAINVPVMTFFSGFHDDYHSPRDIYKKTDPDKMYNVLKLVNGIMLSYLNKTGK